MTFNGIYGWVVLYCCAELSVLICIKCLHVLLCNKLAYHQFCLISKIDWFYTFIHPSLYVNTIGLGVPSLFTVVDHASKRWQFHCVARAMSAGITFHRNVRRVICRLHDANRCWHGCNWARKWGVSVALITRNIFSIVLTLLAVTCLPTTSKKLSKATFKRFHSRPQCYHPLLPLFVIHAALIRMLQLRHRLPRLTKFYRCRMVVYRRVCTIRLSTVLMPPCCS